MYKQLGDIKARILQIAEDSNPYRRKTVKLESEMVQAVVMFKEEKSYTPKLIPLIKDVLGEARFAKLFRIKTEYKGNYQALRAFMATVSSDHNENEAKELITRAEIVTVSQPYIKFVAKDVTVADEGEELAEQVY